MLAATVLPPDVTHMGLLFHDQLLFDISNFSVCGC